MADIKKKAVAGTMESSDVYVEIEPGSGAVEIQLDSAVQQQFGAVIEAVIREVLQDCGVDNAKLRVIDRGALDCVIRARVETAVLRGGDEA